MLLIVVGIPLHAQNSPVPPELGGPGFEEIAEEEGWQTGGFHDEDLPYISDQQGIKGGEIRVPISTYPPTFRAYGKDENSYATRLVHNMVYEPLLSVNPLTLELLPELASHWRVDKDDQTYWFRLDPRARFADGRPVTTKDVIATYDLAVDPRILSPYTNFFYEGFDPPEAISPYIFKVRATQKNWRNLLYFGRTSILPDHVISRLNGGEYLQRYNYRMPTGSGPYEVKLKNVEKGKQVTLTRRKNWWRRDDPEVRGEYNFDSITFVVVYEESKLEAFKRGDVDFIRVNRAQQWAEEFHFDEVERGLIQKRKIYNDNPQGVNGLVFNMRKAPFDNPKVREGFVYLFNRERLVKDIMYNEYVMTNSYYPGSVYENPNNPKVEYDPEKGLALLREAGYTERNREGILVHEETGLPLRFEMPILKNSRRILAPVQEDWKAMGISLRFRMVDFAFQLKLVNERNFSIVFMNWGASLFPNPRSMFHSELADAMNTNNLTGFKNARADELIEEELITYDQGKREKILQELDSILVISHQYALGWYAPFTRVVYWNKFGQPSFYLGKTDDYRGNSSTLVV